jgi:ATP-dependent DNA ligase
MLAKDFHKESKKIDWNNCYAQPKLDGMRCLAFINNGEVRLMSRDGKEIHNMDHIKELFKNLTGVFILDGELYNKDLGGFQSQMKAIKKYSAKSEQINYNVYDMILPKEFRVRWFHLRDVVAKVNHPNLKLVDTYTLHSEKQLKELHSSNITEGYEGSIVRWGDEPYKVNGRSSNLLKYKDFQDIALPIIDIVPADQRPEWGKPIFELNGKQFSAGMKYSHEDRIDFLKNRKDYIGKTAEVRFFEYTDGGLPRFPIMWGIRLDK